jgi:hypothetical protein
MRIKSTKKYQTTTLTDFENEFGKLSFPEIEEIPSDRLGTGGTFEAHNYSSANIQTDPPTKDKNIVPLNTTPDTIGPAPEKPGLGEIILNTLANPLATFGYSVRNEEIPWGRVPRHSNAFDTFALGMFNPAAWVESGVYAYKNFKEGDILGGTLETLGALPVVPASISQLKHLKHAKSVKSSKMLHKELSGYNNEGLFRNITTNHNGKLNESQLNILAQNENLANTTIKNAIKNNDKVVGYRATNPETALVNPAVREALIKDGIDITDHRAVAHWLAGRPHLGGHSLGYRAGGGGSEHWAHGDYLYSIPRWSHLENVTLKTRGFSNKSLHSQQASYGPYVSKFRHKGTEHLTDFTSGNRSTWIQRLREHQPWFFTPRPGSLNRKNALGLNDLYNPKTVNVVTKTDEIVDPRNFFLVDGNRPLMRIPDHPVLYDKTENLTDLTNYWFTFPNANPNWATKLGTTYQPKGKEIHMWFGRRGSEIMDVLDTKLAPFRIGPGPRNIHKEGGHIRTNNLKRK